MILCPVCKTELIYKLPGSAFFICKECETAIREEKDMPFEQKNIYNEGWTLGEDQKVLNNKIAYYRLRQIKKIEGIERILDCGCGTGILVDLLSKNGYVVDGVDSSEANINYSKRHKQGNYLLQDIESLDIGNKYDLIIASHLIEHIRAPEKFLKKVKTTIKKGGFLYIATPNLSAWSAKSLWRENLGGICGTDHRILYSPKSLSRLLRMNNFEIIYYGTKTRFSRMLEEIIRTLYFKKFKAHDRQEPNHTGKNILESNPPVTKRGVKKTYHITVLKGIYKFIKDSIIIDLLFFIPNKISEIKNRGEELIIIAKV